MIWQAPGNTIWRRAVRWAAPLCLLALLAGCAAGQEAVRPSAAESGKSLTAGRPGAIIAGAPKEWEAEFQRAWPGRSITAELYYPTQSLLARTAYDLAVFARDIGPEVDLARFERGAQGFHYHVNQVVGWANSLVERRAAPSTAEGQRLLEWLVASGVLRWDGGRYGRGGAVLHVLGATAGARRAFVLNLNHERLHVHWDENAAFREAELAGWRALDKAEKTEFLSRMRGYDQSRDLQMAEEWAVRRNEAVPPWLK